MLDPDRQHVPAAFMEFLAPSTITVTPNNIPTGHGNVHPQPTQAQHHFRPPVATPKPIEGKRKAGGTAE